MDMTLTTPQGPFLLRQATPEDTPGLLALWQAAFGRAPDPQLWAWKYAGPWGNHTTVAQAPDGRIAVAFPTVPMPVRLEGAPALLELAMDSASHPEFRTLFLGRRGLFAATARLHFAQATARGVLGLYGFPGVRHFRLGALLLGYQACHTQPALWSGTPRPRLWPRLRLRPAHPEDLPALARLDATLGPATASCRTATFLKWRFLDHPSQAYRLWQVRRFTGALVGYLATRSVDQATRVVDLLLPPDPRLVGAALAALAKATHAPLQLWLAGPHPLRPVLQAAGLAPAPEPIGALFAVRPLSPKAPPLATTLAATLADTDVDAVSTPSPGGVSTMCIFL